MSSLWEETVSATGEMYYAHRDTQETRWAMPDESLHEGWEVLRDRDGQPYFIDHTTETSTYVDPRVAPTEVNPDSVDKGYGIFSVSASAAGRGLALDGRVAVVTGASTGIGLETAIALACMGAEVILACRTAEG